MSVMPDLLNDLMALAVAVGAAAIFAAMIWAGRAH
jgi:hypothetical protein